MRTEVAEVGHERRADQAADKAEMRTEPRHD